MTSYHVRVLAALSAAFSVLVLILVPRVLPIHQDLAGFINNSAFYLEAPELASSYSTFTIPFELIFYGIPYLAASALGTSAVTCVVVLSLVLVNSSVLLSCCLLANGRLTTSRVQWAVSTIAMYIVFFVLPLSNKNLFGLREHLGLCLVFPYFLLSLLSILGGAFAKKIRVFAGVGAGVAVCLKPHFAIAIVGVELLHLFYKRDIRSCFRLEAIVPASIAASYLGAWKVAYPDFFGELPMSSEILTQFIVPPSILVFHILFLLFAPIIVVSIYVFCIRRGVDDSRVNEFRRFFFFVYLAVLFGAILFIQARGYPHHAYPIAALTFLLIAFHFRFMPVVVAVLALSLFGLRERLGINLAVETRAVVLEAIEVLKPILDGRSVALLSGHPSPYQQVILESAAKWRFPFRHIVFLVGDYKKFDYPDSAVTYIRSSELSETARVMISKMNGALKAYPNDFVLVDRCMKYPYLFLNLDLLKAFSADPEFASLWENYQLKLSYKSTDTYLAFDLFERKPSR